MRRFIGIAAILMAVGMWLAPGAQAQVAPGNEPIFAITKDTNKLLLFSRSSPETITAAADLIGLPPGEQLVGIDIRPSNQKLYAVSTGNRLYTIDYSTLASGVAKVMLVGPLGVTLSGAEFGFDFNPVTDQLRVVSTSGQNLSINPATGAATVDTPLFYANGSTPPPQVGGIAYDRNDTNPATGTTLYGIDSARDALVLINPPNTGSITTIGQLMSPGAIDVLRIIGFDIVDANSAVIAVLRNGEVTSDLYTVDLTTGKLSSQREIGGQDEIRGIAISSSSAPTPVIPETPFTVLLPVTAAGLLGGAALVLRTRKRSITA